MLATYGVGGLLLALVVVTLPGFAGSATYSSFFFAGMIAVSAWILPAVSGSYMLLVLGLYEAVLTAVRELDFALLASLGVGCVVGLMLFVRLLDWLLARFYEQLLALLTGFMLGSLVNLWPWQLAAVNDWSRYVSPARYASVIEGQAFLIPCVLSMILGSVLLWLIAREPHS